MMKIFLLFILGGTAKIAFLHHGNQHFADNGLYALRPGDSGYNGNSFHRTLDTHEYYNCPVDIHISGTLLQSYTWMQNDRGLLSRLRGDIVNIIGGTYAEHIMPYVDRNINKFSLWYAKTLYENTIGGVGWPDYPNIIWIPERVFKSELLMPYSLIKVLNEEYGKYDHDGRYLAPCIVLDDNVHDWYEHYYPGGARCTNSRKVHRMFDNEGNYVYVVFIQKVARDQMVWNDVSNPSNSLHQLLASLSNDADQEQVVIYGDDWEKAAGVAGWDFGQPGVPAWSYDNNIRFIKSQSWIQPVHITEVVKWWGVDKVYDSDPFNDPPVITIHYGTYQELHDWTGGTYDNWYNNFKNTQAWGCSGGPDLNGNGVYGDYEDLWKFAYDRLMNSPDNEISKLGWITLSSMLYETAWHTGPGGELVYWGKNLWNHTRYGGIFAYGALWFNSLRHLGVARVDSFDLDADGEKEYTLFNNKICFIFEKRGGRALAVFSSDGKCAVGNLMSNWNGEGDFNDGGHPGAFWDSQGENSYFQVQVLTSGDTAILTFIEQYNWQGQQENDLRKSFALTPERNFVKVTYNSNYINWTKAGITPSLYLQLLKGYNLRQIYGLSPNGWTYGGYESLYDSFKVAFIYPSGQGFYFNFKGKMASGAELIELGGKSGTYSFYFYVGKDTPEVDVQGPGDLEGPWISNTTFLPDYNILPTDSVLITARITDPSGIYGAWVRYTSNNWQSYQDLQMTPDNGNDRDYNGNHMPDPDLYGVYIPPYPEGTKIIFALKAVDNSSRRNERWDNNNGQNYSYTVGFQDFVMDGQLDRVANLLASNGDMHLYAFYDSRTSKLYLATESAGNASAGASGRFFNDHFILVSFNPQPMVNAPWGKSGQVGKFHLFLADEDDNNFAGWFDSTGTLITDTLNFKCASYFDDTGYLEGYFKLDLFRNRYNLDTIYIAVASYASYDGGTLQWQVPVPIIPNGDIEAIEYFIFNLDTVAVQDTNQIFLLKCPPLIKTNNIVFQVFSPYAQEARVKIMDITGKILDMEPVFLQKGLNELNLTLKITNSGVYFIFVEARNISLSTKVVIVK
ncbi:MAG: T9SS type A sorting domain-containing protein [candidate division WOR-3 bacterium]